MKGGGERERRENSRGGGDLGPTVLVHLLQDNRKIYFSDGSRTALVSNVNQCGD